MILLCNPLLNSPRGVCGILGRRRWVLQFLRINQYHPPFSLIGGLDYCFAADHVSHPHYCCRTVQEVDAQIHARSKWSGACGSQGSWKIASSVPAPSWSWNVAASQAVVLVLRFHPGLTFGCDKEPEQVRARGSVSGMLPQLAGYQPDGVAGCRGMGRRRSDCAYLSSGQINEHLRIMSHLIIDSQVRSADFVTSVSLRRLPNPTPRDSLSLDYLASSSQLAASTKAAPSR
jgi:hypothetical protein